MRTGGTTLLVARSIGTKPPRRPCYPHRHGPVGHLGRWRHPRVKRPCRGGPPHRKATFTKSISPPSTDRSRTPSRRSAQWRWSKGGPPRGIGLPGIERSKPHWDDRPVVGTGMQYALPPSGAMAIDEENPAASARPPVAGPRLRRRRHGRLRDGSASAGVRSPGGTCGDLARLRWDPAARRRAWR